MFSSVIQYTLLTLNIPTLLEIVLLQTRDVLMQNKLKTQKTRYMSPKSKGLNARYVMVHPKK